jgi:phospholipase/carboxylesterase
MRTTELGGLKVRIAGGTDREGAGDGPAVVLLHGFGAPGDDLASLWRVLPAPPGTRFVFPEAPLSLAAMGMPQGRAWWMIDVGRYQTARTTEDVERLMVEVPGGLASARERVVAMLDATEERLRPSAIVIGGFSQGAMLSVDVALRTTRAFAGLAILSGALIAAREWEALAPQRKNLPVVQSHGRQDAILPFVAAERLRDVLRAGGLEHTWVPFSGGHEIPPSALDALGALLRQRLT